MKKDLTIFRRDFPLLQKEIRGKPLLYFDSAATAQKPAAVIDAMTDFYRNHYATVHRSIYSLSVHATESYHEVRKKLKRFLNASKPEEILFTRGTTESINLIARCFGKAFLHSGDEILISAIEHHSNIVPWQMLCEELGVKLKVIPVDDRGELLLDAFQELLTEKTKLVAVAHVANSIGTVHPIEEVIRLSHKAGAKVLIDGAQAAPHLPIDLAKLDADFYVFSGHKLYGPTGIGVLYGKEELLEAMPPYQGGGDMIERVSFSKTTYGRSPLKFEAGTPMIAEVIGLGAALDYLENIGMDAIAAWEKELVCYALRKLEDFEHLKLIGAPRMRGSIISFSVEGIHPLDLATFLDLEGIAIRSGHHCAQPTMERFGVSGSARLSFGLYNSKEEIDRFVEALKKVIVRLRGQHADRP